MNRAVEKPNRIFFLVDYMGWTDCTVNGCHYYETPNIERLSERDVTFPNTCATNPLYSSPLASILTGHCSERFHMTGASGYLSPNSDTPLIHKTALLWQKVICPTQQSFMPLEEFILAEKSGNLIRKFSWFLKSK